MSYPLIGILGGSRSGKDTVAAIINKTLGGQNIAHADPLKRFSKAVFGFSDDQLWGPSELRNAIHEAGNTFSYWEGVRFKLDEHASAFFQAWGLPRVEWSTGYWPEPTSWPASSYRAWEPLLEHYEAMRKHHEAWTPRIQLQHFGTEFGRTLSQDLWSGQALNLARDLLKGDVAYEATRGVTGTEKRLEGRAPSWVTISDTRFRNEALNIKKAGGLLIKVYNPEITGAVQVGLQGHASETELLSIPSSWLDATIDNDKALGLDVLQKMVVATLRSLRIL